MRTPLDWLQDWYRQQCDGDWEHEYGIRITTLDNPGWRLNIDLAETPLSEIDLPREQVLRSDDDWVSYGVSKEKFDGACGPSNLEELIDIFKKIVDQDSDGQ